METQTLYVLLPALNEADALSKLLPDLGDTLRSVMPYRIVLVDDGSTDATPSLAAAWAKAWPMQLLRHPANQGYGAALKTGFLWVIQNASPADIVVSLDADNTHRPEYIPKLVDMIQDGFDVATASYWAPGGQMSGVPFKRRVMSSIVNGLFRRLRPIGEVRCYTNGFRAYRVAVLQEAYKRYGVRLIEQTGFPGGAELFIKVCRQAVKAGEIPFVLHYENRGGQSKIQTVRTIMAYLQLLKNTRRP